MAKGEFDGEAFYDALDSIRDSKGMTWKQVAGESQVSASTLTRMSQGKRPDVDSLAALVKWSGLNTDDFIVGLDRQVAQQDTLTTISTYLRADPSLSKESAAAIDAVVRAAYDNLKNK